MLINVFVLIDAMVINIKASKMKKFVEVLFIGIVFVEVLFVGIAFVEVFFVAIVFVSSIISLYITTEHQYLLHTYHFYTHTNNYRYSNFDSSYIFYHKLTFTFA